MTFDYSRVYSLMEYDNRSLTSSGSSTYSGPFSGSNAYEIDVNLHTSSSSSSSSSFLPPSASHPHYRSTSPPVRGNSFYDDASSDLSSPPLSPRNSIELRTATPPLEPKPENPTSPSSLSPPLPSFSIRGPTPPPELKIERSSSPSPSSPRGSSSPRSGLHSGHRSNSDGSSTPPLSTKLKRSSSTSNPGSRKSGELVTSPLSPPPLTARAPSPNLPRGSSWDKFTNAFSVRGLMRSGSEDLGGKYSVHDYNSSASETSSNTNYSTNLLLPDESPSNNTSSTSSTPSLTSSGSTLTVPTNNSSSISPTLTRAKKPLNFIALGRSNSDPQGSTELSPSSSSSSSSSRGRSSLKLFSLSRSGDNSSSSPSSPLADSSSLLSPPFSPSSSTSGTSPNKSSSLEKSPNKSEHKFSEMQFLNCSNCTNLVDKSLQAIALQKLPLQCLYLSGCARISDTGVIPLFAACPQLKVLEINDCYKITDASILELAKHCTELKELNVSSCKVNASSIERVAKSCTNLNSLNISGVESISDYTIKVISQRCTNMHILQLGHCPNITDNAIFFIASKLANSLQILTINNGAKITDASITALGNACSSLRTLKLRKSMVSHNSVISLIQSNTMLSRLDLFGSHQLGSPIFDSLLQSGQTLRVLKIAQCYGISNTIAFADPYELFASQSGLRNLTTLDWSDTNLTNKVLENVCTHCKKITKLKLQGCKLITNQAMGFIAKHLLLLQKLRIDRCPQIDDGGLITLSSSFPSSSSSPPLSRSLTSSSESSSSSPSPSPSPSSLARSLTTLSLIRVTISNRSVEAISKFESLQNLHLSNSGNLTPEAIFKLLESCIELQQVYLVLQNANMETNKFLELRQKFPRVKLYFVESGGRK